MHRPEFGTPHYYGPWLERFPDRAARTLTAIARAQPGGVAYHCGIGRDRTGLVIDAAPRGARRAPEEAAEDYALSAGRCPSRELDFWAAQPRRRRRSSQGSWRASTRTRYLDPGDLAALEARTLNPEFAPPA